MAKEVTEIMTLTPFVTTFFVLGFVTAILALYRKLLAMREDDYVHFTESEAKYIPQQLAMAHRIHIIDRWGETLTILTAVAGLIVIGVYVYLTVNAV